jgi:hypothetical protein
MKEGQTRRREEGKCNETERKVERIDQLTKGRKKGRCIQIHSDS